MHVVALCGSLRADSSTRRALSIALDAAARAGATVSWVETSDLPWCDGRPAGDYGASVTAFRAALTGADALLIGSPEYHGSFSGALKNALDLLEPGDLKGKLIALVASAKGEAGAMNTLNHLRHVARWVDAWVLPAQVSIPVAGEAFSASGEITRPALKAELETLGEELVRFGKLLAGA